MVRRKIQNVFSNGGDVAHVMIYTYMVHLYRFWV